MARFNAAVMSAAQDSRFQNRYNYLLDLLDSGYVVEKRIDGSLIKISIDPKGGIVISQDGSQIAGLVEVGGEWGLLSQFLTSSPDADFYASVGDVTVGSLTYKGILGFLNSHSTTSPIFTITSSKDALNSARYFQLKSAGIRLHSQNDVSPDIDMWRISFEDTDYPCIEGTYSYGGTPWGRVRLASALNKGWQIDKDNVVSLVDDSGTIFEMNRTNGIKLSAGQIRVGSTHYATVMPSATSGEYLFGGTTSATGGLNHYVRVGTDKLQFNSTSYNNVNIWHAGNDGAGSGLDADLLDGISSGGSGSNGATWGYIPQVKNDGVIEIGRYIDFHHKSNDGVDYAVRLATNGSTNGQLYITNKKIWHQGDVDFAVGSGTSSSTSGADTSVSFGKTFASAPKVCANSINGSYTCRIKSVSTTGFVLVISGSSVTFNYIAVLT